MQKSGGGDRQVGRSSATVETSDEERQLGDWGSGVVKGGLEEAKPS